MGLEEGFRVIAANCLAQMQDNAPGVLQGAGSECIHQMRVGMRRLRSAWRLFARWIPPPTALIVDLAWLRGELGAARDADVLADITLPRLIASCPQAVDWLPLRTLTSKMAGEKRQQAARAVASVRCSRLMLGLADWLWDFRWRDALSESARRVLATPLKRRARKILDRRHKVLLEKGRRLVSATAAERHQVRIAAKKARYAAEFFGSLEPAGCVKRYVGRLASLQDVLGSLNDATVADRLLREIATAYPALSGSAFFARGYLRAETKRDLEGLIRSWRQFESMGPP
jgi:CHAD domain-containing protein